MIADSPAADASTPRPVRPADRYGDRPVRPRRRGVLVLVAAVAAALVAAGLGWVAWGMLQPQAEGEVGTFDVIDETGASFVLEVTRPVGSTAVCTVEALGEGFAQVGLLEVTIEPGDDRVSRVETTIATSAIASMVSVRGCELA